MDQRKFNINRSYIHNENGNVLLIWLKDLLGKEGLLYNWQSYLKINTGTLKEILTTWKFIIDSLI